MHHQHQHQDGLFARMAWLCFPTFPKVIVELFYASKLHLMGYEQANF